MQEYPKVIHVGGILQTVASAEEEARWRGESVTTPDPAPEPEPPSLPEAVVTPLTEPDATEETQPEASKPRTLKGGKKK